MTGSTISAAHLLRDEATSAATSNTVAIASEPYAQAGSNGPTTGGYRRGERKRDQLISSIRQAAADMVLATGEIIRVKNSDYLSRRLNHDYTYLANLFSETTGSTIEQYIIELRIDRVKVLLLAGKLNLTQISHQLNYSSVAHLSNQFKKVTGLTPSLFKMLHPKSRIVVESVNDVNVFCNCVNDSKVRRVRFAA